jgi:hypothetical protein
VPRIANKTSLHPTPAPAILRFVREYAKLCARQDFEAENKARNEQGDDASGNLRTVFD